MHPNLPVSPSSMLKSHHRAGNSHSHDSESVSGSIKLDEVSHFFLVLFVDEFTGCMLSKIYMADLYGEMNWMRTEPYQDWKWIKTVTVKL